MKNKFNIQELSALSFEELNFHDGFVKSVEIDYKNNEVSLFLVFDFGNTYDEYWITFNDTSSFYISTNKLWGKSSYIFEGKKENDIIDSMNIEQDFDYSNLNSYTFQLTSGDVIRIISSSFHIYSKHINQE